MLRPVQPFQAATARIRPGPQASPLVWCEILPLTLSAGQIMRVQRQGDAAGSAWVEPHSTAAHPGTTVRLALEACFGSPLDPGTSVVHSTAWRYELDSHYGGTVILTYLAILPPLGHQAIAHSRESLVLEPVGSEPPARSGTLTPPAQIALAHVLAHGLDHLTLLLETDHAIAESLGPAWRAALACRQRRPSGELRLVAGES